MRKAPYKQLVRILWRDQSVAGALICMRDKTWTECEVRQPRKSWTPERRQQVRDLLEEALRLIETTGLAPEVAAELDAAIRELDALPE